MKSNINADEVAKVLHEHKTHPQNSEPFSKVIDLFKGSIKYSASTYPTFWQDDFIQEGKLGLLNAFQHTKTDCSPTEFICYAKKAINNSMLNFYKKVIINAPIITTINTYDLDCEEYYDTIKQISDDMNYESTLTFHIDFKHYINDSSLKEIGIKKKDYDAFVNHDIVGYDLNDIADMEGISVSQASKIISKVRYNLIKNINKGN